MSVVAKVASDSTRPLCAGLALSISLMCALLGFAASATPATGMTEMVSHTGMAGMPGSLDTGEASGAGAPVAAWMEMDTGGDDEPAMSSMCGAPCVTDIGGACTIAAGLIIAALLVLFMASRRDTFVGLRARLGPVLFVRRRRRDPTPWTVLSLSRLCVLRV